MAAKRRSKTSAQDRWALFWVTTADASENCFVVARSESAAARFFEDEEGYDRGDAEVQHVVDLPASLRSVKGWRETPSAPPTSGASYASDALILGCGGEIAAQRTDSSRETLGASAADYRFGARHFRAGDVVTTSKRALGISEPARLSAFRGEKPEFPTWWEWELELTPHLEKRMDTRFRERHWEVIVEPDDSEELLVVVTAYGVNR